MCYKKSYNYSYQYDYSYAFVLLKATWQDIHFSGKPITKIIIKELYLMSFLDTEETTLEVKVT